MVDLKTSYLGLKLKNPLVASASPLSEKVDTARRLEDAGVSAIVMYSLFEEQIIHESLALDHFLTYGTEAFAEAITYLPEMGRYTIGPEAYIEHLYRLKQAVSIPVIGSLNGVSAGGWTEYAQKIEQAGADALELNIYYLSFDPNLTSAELEDAYVTLVGDIRAKVSIPLAVKISPFFTGLANFVHKLTQAGADGLVLFNRFYQPDFDLENLEVVPNLVLSSSHELRLPLRWIALLYGQIEADFALTSGVHTGEDILKAMMAGASVTMVASELLKNGVGRATEMLSEMQAWMTEHEYESVTQMKGSMSQKAFGRPNALRRANYMKELSSYSFKS
ncbi:MAG: dihydroorotate dehydrogenase-like protein [Chloroflexota bacterium]|nr:MAG: dihydroorotate dehydrogenase-like protein [Chloroflexota bacterium]